MVFLLAGVWSILCLTDLISWQMVSSWVLSGGQVASCIESCVWVLLVSVQCNIIQIGGFLHQLVSRWASERRMPTLRQCLAFHPDDMYAGWRRIMMMLQIPLCMMVTAGLSYAQYCGLDIHVQYLTPGFPGFSFPNCECICLCLLQYLFLQSVCHRTVASLLHSICPLPWFTNE